MKKTILSLTLIVLAALLLALPRPAQAQDVTTDLLTRINNLRAGLGLPGYTLNSALSAAARNQAQWMAQTGLVSHTQDNGSTPRTRAQAAGYTSTWVSENIYIGTNATAASAFNWWLNSPIHYRGMTNANYSEIGIASASGPAFDGATAFVLVFGNPGGGWVAPAPARSSGSGNAASGPPVQPPYVVGVDNTGNIMHEIQAGHTLGEIALIYGYTWDDLEMIRQLNGMTEPEGRQLEIGAILLVPPHDGTYTPTPAPQDEAGSPGEATAEADAGQPRATQAAPTVTPSATPSPTVTPPIVVVTSAVVPEWVVDTPTMPPPDTAAGTVTTPAWTAATVTPAATGVAMAAGSEGEPPASGMIDPVAVDMDANTPPGGSGDGTPPLLIVAVGLQVVIIFGAGVEFVRRMRREA